VGPSQPLRQWMDLSLGNPMQVDLLPPPPEPAALSYLQAIDLEIGFSRRNANVSEQFSADQMMQAFVKAFDGLAMSTNQTVMFEFRGHKLKAVVMSTLLVELAEEQQNRGGGRPRPPTKYPTSGIIMDKTDVSFLKAPDSTIRIKASSRK